VSYRIILGGLTLGGRVWEVNETFEELPPSFPSDMQGQKDRWRGKVFYVEEGSEVDLFLRQGGLSTQLDDAGQTITSTVTEEPVKDSGPIEMAPETVIDLEAADSIPDNTETVTMVADPLSPEGGDTDASSADTNKPKRKSSKKSQGSAKPRAKRTRKK